MDGTGQRRQRHVEGQAKCVRPPGRANCPRRQTPGEGGRRRRGRRGLRPRFQKDRQQVRFPGDFHGGGISARARFEIEFSGDGRQRAAEQAVWLIGGGFQPAVRLTRATPSRAWRSTRELAFSAMASRACQNGTCLRSRSTIGSGSPSWSASGFGCLTGEVGEGRRQGYMSPSSVASFGAGCLSSTVGGGSATKDTTAITARPNDKPMTATCRESPR